MKLKTTNASSCFRCSGATDSFSCLVTVDTNTLQAANSNILASFFFGTFGFVPVVDGSFIEERPYEAILAGKLNGVSSCRDLN